MVDDIDISSNAAFWSQRRRSTSVSHSY